jgi:hypothetical protein
MENLTYYILGLYVLPMVFNLIFVYSDKQIKTLGDLMTSWWGYFVPIVNLLVMIAIPIYYISEYFESNKIIDKIKNIKIK